MKYQKKFKLKSVNKFFFTASLTSIALAPIFSWQSAQGTPVPAKSANAFVDSIGVNVHLDYDGPYEKFEELVKPKLKELGIRHIRDGAYQSEAFFKKIKDLAANGIKSTLIFSGNQPAEVVETAKKLQGAIEAVEGPNESDLEQFNFAYKGEKFPGGTRNYQKEIYSAIKSDPATKNLPVVLPSMGWGQNADRVGEIANLGDLCTMHSYPNIGNPPSIDLDQYFIPHIEKMCGKILPKWVTETGYNNAISNELGISEQAAGKYIPRLFLENFNRGIKLTHLYELINQGDDPNDDQSNFGLMHKNGSPKPAYTAIKNLNYLLEDSKANFKTESLDYNLNADPKKVHTTLLQKSNRDFYLIVWQNANSWDNDSKKDISVPSQSVTLNLNSPIAKAEVYDPIKSTVATATKSNPKRLSVAVPDYPIVVKLSPANGSLQPSNSQSKPENSSSRSISGAENNQLPLNEKKPNSSGSQSPSSENLSKPSQLNNKEPSPSSSQSNSSDSDIEKTPSSSPSSSQNPQSTNTDSNLNQSQSSNGNPASSNSQSNSSDSGSGKQNSHLSTQSDRFKPNDTKQPDAENGQPLPSEVEQPDVENGQSQPNQIEQQSDVKNKQPQSSEVEQLDTENKQPQSSEVEQPDAENKQPQ